jgi:hypothetical protein
LGLERLPYETLDEWWKRIGLKDTLVIHQIYAKVRYGMVDSTLEEQVYVKEVTFNIKQRMKELAENDRQS